MDNNIAQSLLEHFRTRKYGKFRATVADNNDPTNRGRIKVTIPAVLADLQVWAMPCFPYSGNGAGHYMIPEAGAGVWVEFEAGDPSFPIWTGGFWADNELPKDQNGTQATPSLRIIRSQQGLIISMDDKGNVITLSDSNGNNIITIDSTKSEIKIHSNMKVVVDAPQIELVEGSSHPLVFGDNLMTYLNQLVSVFNTHMHMGEMCAVGPVSPMVSAMPFPSPTPDLLSIKVTTG